MTGWICYNTGHSEVACVSKIAQNCLGFLCKLAMGLKGYLDDQPGHHFPELRSIVGLSPDNDIEAPPPQVEVGEELLAEQADALHCVRDLQPRQHPLLRLSW